MKKSLGSLSKVWSRRKSGHLNEKRKVSMGRSHRQGEVECARIGMCRYMYLSK